MPTITFGGVGSGIDTESIISGLLSASQGPINRVQTQRNQVEAAVSSLSDIGSLLSKFESAVQALDTLREAGSFKAESSHEAITAVASGAAQPGSFDVTVSRLASAYKAYSEPLGVSQSSQALGKAGTLELSVGGENASIEVAASDSLDAVIAKINASGLRVSASSLFDGTQFRIQLRGLDTGLANDVTVSDPDALFGFDLNTKSTGQDAEFTVDGFSVTSASNQVQGVIPGVTLALTQTTEDPVTVNVSSDPDGFKAKLQSLVDAYNALVNKINSVAGHGSVKAANAELAGDSALRAITNRLGIAVSQSVGDGKYQTLRSIGIELDNNGTLSLDAAKLTAALADDPNSASTILAGDDAEIAGLADIMVDIADQLLGEKAGLAARKESLSARQKLLGERIDLEQRRLDRMEEQLRKQFTQMDSVVAANQAQLSFLLR